MRMVTVAALMLLLAGSMSGFGKDIRDRDAIKVVSTKSDILYFKVGAALVGGSVEVYDAQGGQILEAQITSKKVLIDFFGKRSGEYRIVIRKDNVEKDIVYTKQSK